MNFTALLFILVLCGTSAQLPGFKTVISQNGLTYLKGVGVQLLEQAITTLSIPELDGEAVSYLVNIHNLDTPIGKVDYTLSNIVLSGFAIGSSDATIVPSQGITLSLSGVTAAVSMNWHYKEVHGLHISDSGTANIDVQAVSASAAISVAESNGHLTVSVVSDTVSIGNLDIHLHGGASWLYNVFVKLFAGQIKSAIANALTQAITNNINQGLNTALATLPMIQPINKFSEINFEITSNPLFDASYIEASANGEFYATANPTECPASICPRFDTPNTLTSSMVQMIVSEFVPNSAGYVYQGLGRMVATITNNDLPPDSPVSLNTSSFVYIIPQLYKAFPNMAVQLRVSATEPPKTSFATSGATVFADGTIEVEVVSSNGTVMPAFTLVGNITTSGTASLNGMLLMGNLTYLSGSFSLGSSEIGDINVTPLVTLLNLLFSQGIIPQVNQFLASGIPLPAVQGLTFQNPQLGWGSHYLYVSTDVTYTPPAANGMKPVFKNPITVQ